jgi:hypothetical protein
MVLGVGLSFTRPGHATLLARPGIDGLVSGCASEVGVIVHHATNFGRP